MWYGTCGQMGGQAFPLVLRVGQTCRKVFYSLAFEQGSSNWYSGKHLEEEGWGSLHSVMGPWVPHSHIAPILWAMPPAQTPCFLSLESKIQTSAFPNCFLPFLFPCPHMRLTDQHRGGSELSESSYGGFSNLIWDRGPSPRVAGEQKVIWEEGSWHRGMGWDRKPPSGCEGLTLALKPAVWRPALPLQSLRCYGAGNSPHCPHWLKCSVAFYNTTETVLTWTLWHISGPGMGWGEDRGGLRGVEGEQAM